jgi:MED6 mediator sub complex component
MSEQSPYIDIHWLDLHTRAVGLHRENVIEYFYTSPFYDSLSCNEILRQRSLSWAETNQHLLSMIGIQFLLVEDINSLHEPDLFVIKRINRITARSFEVLTVYYCFEGVIYQGPGFINLIGSRLCKSSWFLYNSFLIALGTSIYNENGHRLWCPDDSSSPNNIDNDIVKHSDIIATAMYIPKELPSQTSTKRDMMNSNFIDSE